MLAIDQRTLDAYDRHAADYARDWNAQPAPTDLQAILQRFFRPGPTADIGCGSGRDTAWLNRNGFSAIGFDASAGLISEARRLHPGISFQQSALPDLDGIAAGSFANILCETVIMHLVPLAVPPAIHRLVALLQPGGTLYVSWRTTDKADQRDDRGRLYASFPPDLVRRALPPADVLLDEELQSESSGKRIHRIVARKPGA